MRVVPPQADVEVVAYRTAWLRGRFETTRRPGGYHAHLHLSTNQGWHERVRHDRPFAIPCCPGEVILDWDGRELYRGSRQQVIDWVARQG